MTNQISELKPNTVIQEMLLQSLKKVNRLMEHEKKLYKTEEDKSPNNIAYLKSLEKKYYNILRTFKDIDYGFRCGRGEAK